MSTDTWVEYVPPNPFANWLDNPDLDPVLRFKIESLTRPSPLVTIEHLNGIEWSEAPLPRRWHKCVAQTRGYINFALVERCACGGVKDHRYPGLGGPGWLHKNERRGK